MITYLLFSGIAGIEKTKALPQKLSYYLQWFQEIWKKCVPEEWDFNRYAFGQKALAAVIFNKFFFNFV